mmetsp:Transcript_97666/g.271743  ORF Transcript_97666/g.271743 Transcript_97666/m.271743 type:complete len:275 (+) Transcript_97666:122-946(+)
MGSARAAGGARVNSFCCTRVGPASTPQRCRTDPELTSTWVTRAMHLRRTRRGNLSVRPAAQDSDVDEALPVLLFLLLVAGATPLQVLGQLAACPSGARWERRGRRIRNEGGVGKAMMARLLALFDDVAGRLLRHRPQTPKLGKEALHRLHLAHLLDSKVQVRILDRQVPLQAVVLVGGAGADVEVQRAPGVVHALTAQAADRGEPGVVVAVDLPEDDVGPEEAERYRRAMARDHHDIRGVARPGAAHPDHDRLEGIPRSGAAVVGGEVLPHRQF